VAGDGAGEWKRYEERRPPMRMPDGFGMIRETLALRHYRLFVIGTL
jgi:hypothetical protein